MNRRAVAPRPRREPASTPEPRTVLVDPPQEDPAARARVLEILRALLNTPPRR